MYKFLQKNSKKLLAIFAVGLMIVFILPSTFNRQGAMNPVIGTITQGNDEIELRADQFQIARSEFEILARYVSLPRPNQNMSILQGYFSPLALEQMEQHPEMYLLLQQEARRMGIHPNVDQVETIMRNQVRMMESNPALAADIRQAVNNFVRVIGAYSRAASTVKVSQPLRQHAVAQEWQQIRLDIVEYRASEFTAAVPAPTAEQLRAHYEQFKDVDPNTATAQSNGGFGYRLPNRVKIQTIQIPIDAVRAVVKARKTDYDWEVEGYKYYSKNLKEFPSTQPAASEPESASSAFTLGATTKLAVTTGPATRPFEEVRGQIVEKIINAEAQKLAVAIQNQIQSTLANDYRLHADPPATAAAPTSAPASGYTSHEYLQTLAANIHRQFGVLPVITSRADSYLSDNDLTSLPGIGSAFGEQTPFADMVMSRAAAFVPPPSNGRPQSGNLLELHQPSPALTDFAGNIYFFRITDMQTSRPAEFDEVAQKVEQDWRAAQAMKLAEESAKKLLMTARQTQDASLASAARQAGRSIITTGQFTNRPGAPLENYTLPTSANGAFVMQAFELLTDAAESGGEHPMRLIELPNAQRVVVAQLKDVEPVWDEQSYSLFDLRTGQELSRVYEQLFQNDWFTYDNVKARLSYHSEEPEAEQSDQPPSGSPPPPGRQPLF